MHTRESSPRRALPWVEVLLVLGLSLGRAGIYAAVTLLDSLTREQALAEQSTNLNPQLAERAWLDLTYQLLGIGFSLVPALLALYLLGGQGAAHPLREGARRIGLTGRLGRGRAVVHALALAAAVGLPGLAVYALSRAAGLTLDVATNAGTVSVTAVVVLVLAALRNGLLEEVIAVGYLTQRCDDAGVRPAVSIGASALLRGSYHLYQGVSAGVGNMVMGVVYGWFYWRTGRVWPLVIAHFLIDAIAFVGYSALGGDLAVLGL